MESVPKEVVEALNFSTGERMALLMVVRQLMSGRPELQRPMARAVERFQSTPQFEAMSESERAGFMHVMKTVL